MTGLGDNHLVDLSGNGRSWLAVALGALGLAISWSAIGLLGAGAGVGAVVLGANERRRRSDKRVATVAVVLGVAAIAVCLAVVLVTILRAVNDGTFDTG